MSKLGQSKGIPTEKIEAALEGSKRAAELSQQGRLIPRDKEPLKSLLESLNNTNSDPFDDIPLFGKDDMDKLG